jgi:hypothetical protein
VQLTYHVSLARSVFDFEGLMVLLSAAVKSLLSFLRCLDQGGHSGDFCLFFLLRKRGARLSKFTV